MLTDDDSFQLQINNLHLILNCFYIYLLSNTFEYVKQVIFHYPKDFLHINNYVRFRCLISLFFQTIYSILIIYSLWLKHIGTLIITTFLLITFILVRFIFDMYGNTYQYSIYFPFEFLSRNQTNGINSNEKYLYEEISDLIIELITNSIGILLAMICIFRMLRQQWQQHEQTEMKIIRRMTV